MFPVAALGTAIAVPNLVGLRAEADPGLPSLSAQQLLTAVVQARPVPMSGEVTQSANLGLPELPRANGQPAAVTNPLGLLSGTHQWRVWSNGLDGNRVALVDGTSETNVISNATDTWVYTSGDRTAIHSTHPKGADSTNPMPSTPTATPQTPQQMAADILKNLDPTTTVTTGKNTTVAGRPSYVLVLTPKDQATRVGQVQLYVDGTTKLPLRVVITSKVSTKPAIDVGFTSVSFTAPAASTFTFTPPAGVTVKQAGDIAKAKQSELPKSTKPARPTEPTVVGAGWSRVVVTTLPAGALGPSSSKKSDNPASSVLGQLPTVSGSWGTGKLLNGTLISVVITNDGRVAAGAVAPEALYAALG